MSEWWVVVVPVGSIVAGIAAVANVVWGRRAQARRRLARGKQALVEGEVVTLVGTVRAVGPQLVAPLSWRDCVVYEITIRTPDPEGVLVQQVTRLTAFELVTADRVVLVDGETAELATRGAPIVPRKLEREQTVLAALERTPRDAVVSSFEEAVVCVGDKVRVQGIAELHASNAGERGYRDAPICARLVAHASHPLTIGRAR